MPPFLIKGHFIKTCASRKPILQNLGIYEYFTILKIPLYYLYFKN